MAVAVANLTTGSDTDGGTSCVTASITPTANSLVLLTVTSRTGITADPSQPTVTGNGLTWVQIGSTQLDSTSASRRRVTLLRAMGPAPTAGAITIDFAGQNQTSMTWVVDECASVDTSGTNGSGAVVQSAVNQNPVDTGVTSLTVTLADFTSTANATYGGFGNGGEGAMTAGTGFTITAQTQVASSNGAAAEFKATNDTSVDITTPTAFIGGIAIEIRVVSIRTLPLLGAGL